MLTKGALEDLIYGHISRQRTGAKPVPKKVPELGKKVFLSDREIKRLYQPGARSVRVPFNAIVSPLAAEWLDYEGVAVVRE
jgi:hypothetical protein